MYIAISQNIRTAHDVNTTTRYCANHQYINQDFNQISDHSKEMDEIYFLSLQKI